MSDTDRALVVQSRHGDRAAFAELVRRTGRLVFARLYLGCGDAHQAEDRTQETFLRAWRSVRQVNDPEGFRTWLLSIAHGVEIDARRREGRKKRGGGLVPGADLEQVPDGARGPLAQAEANESRQRVLSALRSLPEEYRLPLMLRYLGGADYETIARQLALSNGSLRGLLHRGMQRLREMLAEEA